MKSKTFVQRIAPVGYGLLLAGLIVAPFLGAYPVFVIMAIVLLIRPAGLFGKEK